MDGERHNCGVSGRPRLTHTVIVVVGESEPLTVTVAMHPMSPHLEPLVQSSAPAPPAEAGDRLDFHVIENETVPLDAAEADRRIQSDRRREAHPPLGGDFAGRPVA